MLVDGTIAAAIALVFAVGGCYFIYICLKPQGRKFAGF